MQDIVWPLADFFQWTFGLVELADNLPNIAVVLLGFGGLALWMMLQRKYTKEAKKNGTLI
jgi:hypothetical protein